jgi:hypothetical protein
LISLLDGTAAWISGPLPGKTHDARVFEETGAADILKQAGGGFGEPVERLVGHFKNWKILHTDYRRRTPPTMTRSTQPAVFSYSQSHGVLNNAQGR